jgi:hypothetical protein
MTATAKASPSAAFYCVADSRYFLGAVGLVNSLRALGHDEPIHLTDCGLTQDQRDLLATTVELVDAPADTPPALLKTIGPNRHPADVIVQLDTDLLATRHLGELIDTAAAGKLVAFENKSDRWVPEWGELLDLGELRRQRYLDFAALCMHSSIAREVQPLIEDRQGLIDIERTYWGSQDADYPLLYADQDVMNAIVAARVPAERTVILPGRFAPVPPFPGLRVDDDGLTCRYGDGEQPFVVHHHIVKPWLVPTEDGVYSRLLRRHLVGDALAVEVPTDLIPLRFRSGLRASVVRQRINARERLRR